MITGCEKHFSDVTSVTCGGVSYTPKNLTGVLATLVGLLEGVDAARTSVEEKKKVLVSQAPALRTVVRALRALVRATFGNSPEALRDFGLEPHKAPGPRKLGAKVLAAKKNLATREARHTTGRRRKAAIKGNVPEGGSPQPPPTPPTHA